MAMHPFRELVNHLAQTVGLDGAANTERFVEIFSEFRPFSGWNRRDTYWYILGRLPEASKYCCGYESNSERALHIWECLSSDELRFRLIERLKFVFQDRNMKIFLHVPRTAGTTVREYIESNLGIVTWNFLIETQEDISSLGRWNHFSLNYDEFLIKFLIQVSDIFKMPMIITGHASLSDVLKRNILGPEDSCFSIVRDPLDIVKSLIKYHFKIARDHADRDDGRLWRDHILVWDPAWNPDRPPSAYLMHRMIQSDLFQRECVNIVTRSFSADADVSNALENIKISNCKILNMSNIRDVQNYVNEKFKIENEFFVRNESDSYELDIYDSDYNFLITKLIANDIEMIAEVERFSASSDRS